MLQRGTRSSRCTPLARTASRCRRTHCRAANAETTKLDSLNTWFATNCDARDIKIAVSEVEDEATRTQVLGCLATEDIEVDQVVCELPQTAAVTSVDAASHPVVCDAASGRSEIAALALWLLAERISPLSAFAPFIEALPEATNTPILWEADFRDLKLAGSPTLPLAREREAAIRKEWADIEASMLELGSDALKHPGFNEQAFLQAFCVVLAHAVYLPSARCFALLPYVSFMQRTGNDNGCTVDYDLEREEVIVKATRPFLKGQPVLLDDPRPNTEKVLATGTLQDTNFSDYLLFEAKLVSSDRLYTSKREVLMAMNMQETEIYPMYKERFPIQLLSFIRFSRIQDIGELAKVQFDQDVIISPQNEYETLQLVMADLRERLQGYRENQEEDLKMLQNADLEPLERLAALTRRSEKDILLSTTDAVRQRLAPIRGIPTKSGTLEDPNQDLLDIFESVEGIGSAPQKLWKSFSRWASGKDDPDFRR
eukprot:jgi/Ulvmu1/227/UM001_0231.1